MTDLSSPNGYGDASAPTKLANVAVGDHAASPSQIRGESQNRKSRANKTPTVSLVIPVRNEGRNIAWVLEQVANDVNALEAALLEAREDETRPTLLVLRSHVGYPSPDHTDDYQDDADQNQPMGQANIKFHSSLFKSDRTRSA